MLGEERTAEEEIARILGERPLLDAAVAPGIRYCAWQHEALHDETRPMADHVIMSYSGPVRRIERRRGLHWDRSVTRDSHVTLIPAGDFDRWDIHGKIKADHIYFSREALQQFAEENGGNWAGILAPRTATPDLLGSQLIKALGTAAGLGAKADQALVEHLVGALFLHIMRTHDHGSRLPELAKGGLSPRHLARVLDAMRGRLGDQLGLGELASMVGLSSFHFARSFRNSTGRAPHQFLCQLRMDHACELLRHSDASITEIAAQVGYTDSGYFARAFKRMIGVTPTDYRKDLPG